MMLEGVCRKKRRTGC